MHYGVLQTNYGQLLDKLGLFEAIKWLVAGFQNKTGIESFLHVNNLQTNYINKVAEINIFRICQEAITNIAKHAEATLVEIDISNKDEQLSIKISDNGKGFASPALSQYLSMGLLNMKERANMIGAELHIVSVINQGTTIEMIINSHERENINSRRSFCH